MANGAAYGLPNLVGNFGFDAAQGFEKLVVEVDMMDVVLGGLDMLLKLVDFVGDFLVLGKPWLG